MIKSRKQMFIVVGAFALVLMLGTVTYAFFNYTRTGSANTIRTGRIAFNSQQGTAINLTNVFPVDVTNGIPNNSNVGSVTINVTGDTTYEEGVEYLVSAINVQNTVGSGANAKTLPISIDVSVASNTNNDPATTLGTADSDYFTNRGSSASTSIYKVLAGDVIANNDQLVVGYIKSGATGVDGNIVIRAYLDASKVAISDTYNETTPETDQYGTTSNWVGDRVVFTTSEWNSLQTNGVSFQVKVEANEGIWVTDPNGSQEEVWNATDTSCFTYTELNDEITITGYDVGTCGTDVVIPKKINNLDVTTIDDYAFRSKGLTSVGIPNTITIIGISAFAYNSLTSINLPDSITLISQNAFDTNQLTSVTIPSGFIDCNAFANNLITTVEILSGVTEIYNSDGWFVFENNPVASIYIDMIYISDSAFSSSSNTYLTDTLTTVTFGPHVQTIGNGAFSSNANLTSITIPSGVTTIGDWAFYGNNLTSVTIPSSVTTIGESAFNDNSLSSLTIQSGVTTIGESAFSSNNLTSITIPSSVTTIGESAFNNNSLSSLTIQSGVTTIGESAFNSNNLTSITIPSSVTIIGDYAFKYNNISSVTIKGKNSSNDFDSYGNDIWGWDDGYDDSNIIWEGSN